MVRDLFHERSLVALEIKSCTKTFFHKFLLTPPEISVVQCFYPDENNLISSMLLSQFLPRWQMWSTQQHLGFRFIFHAKAWSIFFFFFFILSFFLSFYITTLTVRSCCIQVSKQFDPSST